MAKSAKGKSASTQGKRRRVVRKRLPRPEPAKRLGLRIPEDLWRQLTDAGHDRRVVGEWPHSLNGIVEEAIRDWLDVHGREG